MSPAVIMIAGALLAPLLPGRARGPWLIALPLVALAVIWAVPLGAMSSIEFLDYTLTPWQMNSIGRLFATVFAIMAAAGTLYGLHQARPIELVAAQIYAGSAIGVCFSGDLITLFAYWEIMALASTVVIWSNGSERAYRASLRYVVMHLFGGVLLMAGIAGHVTSTGSVAFGPLALDRAAHWLILAGVLLNAGAPPLSAWIPDAYPEASPSGSVFLSAFTTKTAVFVLWVAFAGAPILVWVGLYMIFYGIIYALLENDMRRILAYSIVNQVGFMVAGIGIGTEMALNGAAAHAFAHIIYKALLLMSAGAVLYMTGKRKCTDLGGLFQSMPLTTVCGIVGALAISAFPLTSGFGSCSPQPLPGCSCTPASSFPGSYSFKKTPACAHPTRRAICGWRWCYLQFFASRLVSIQRRFTPFCRFRWTTFPIRPHMSSRSCSCCYLLVWRFSRCCR
jgi:multicomponent Na+:H+ antiporter subunit D